MKKNDIKTIGFGLVFLVCYTLSAPAQQNPGSVKVVGAMKNVMWKGQLKGTIDLDTLSGKQHVYGLGPVEYLSGELMILDGVAYKSSVLTDTTMKVEETFGAKAPFFVYARVDRWSEQSLPDSILTTRQLESYLNQVTRSFPRPFAFRLSGVVETATIHVVNLPKGAAVQSPSDAHQGQQRYYLHDQPSEILGFFSTEHKSVFTHHDTFLHMHLLTRDRKQMGHLDDILFKSGSLKLYLPSE